MRKAKIVCFNPDAVKTVKGSEEMAAAAYLNERFGEPNFGLYGRRLCDLTSPSRAKVDLSTYRNHNETVYTYRIPDPAALMAWWQQYKSKLLRDVWWLAESHAWHLLIDGHD